MKNIGWIKLHRNFLNWEWYDQPNMVWLFLKCLLLANHESKKWRGIDIPRGSFITSLEALSNKKAKVSVQQVRTALNRLKSTGEITIKTTNQYTHIYVNNYEEYQSFNNQNNNQITNDQQTNNKQITTTNNDKNIKNNNIYTSRKSLTNELCIEISKQFSVSEQSVIKIKDELIRHCKAHNKRYSNYRFALEEWVQRNLDNGNIFKTIKSEIPDLPEISETQRQKNIQALSEIKQKLTGRGLSG